MHVYQPNTLQFCLSFKVKEHKYRKSDECRRDIWSSIKHKLGLKRKWNLILGHKLELNKRNSIKHTQ